MFKLDLEKAEELEAKLPTSTGSSKKKSKRVPEKHLLLFKLDLEKAEEPEIKLPASIG